MLNVTESAYRYMGKDRLISEKHYHENTIEFIQPIASEGSILVDNRLYPMISGAIYIIDSENLHCTLPKDTEKYCRNKFSVLKSELEPLLISMADEDFLKNMLKKCIFPQGEEGILKSDELFRKIFTSQGDFLTALATLELCALCAINKEEKPLTCNKYIEKAIEYINLNIETLPDIKSICEHIHLSQSYLCHIFKKELHMTVTEYIRKQQTVYAIRLLKTTTLPISIVAERCGFSGIEHFCKSFKKQMGISPLKYRKEHSLFG